MESVLQFMGRPGFEVDGRDYSHMCFLHYNGELFFGDGSFLLSYQEFGSKLGDEESDWVDEYIEDKPGQDFMWHWGDVKDLDSPDSVRKQMEGDFSHQAELTSFCLSTGLAHERLVLLQEQVVMFDDRIFQILEGSEYQVFGDKTDTPFKVVVNGKHAGMIMALKRDETAHSDILSTFVRVAEEIKQGFQN